MFITDPDRIAAWTNERLYEGYLQNRLGILQHALENANKEPSAEAVIDALGHINQTCHIAIPIELFSRLLCLYPYERAKLADYGWGDTEVEGLMLDVVANAFLGSRWPIGEDNCDMKAFVHRLKFAVAVWIDITHND